MGQKINYFKQGLREAFPQNVISTREIDCSKNPLDVRPAADAIVKATLQKWQRLEEGEKFVLLMGEKHDVPTHIALQNLVISRLLDANKAFRIAFEIQATFLADFIQNAYNHMVSDQEAYYLNRYDPDGHKAMAGYLSNLRRSAEDAPFTRQNLFTFCLHNNIPLEFNDSGLMTDKEKGKRFVDLKDPFINDLLPDLPSAYTSQPLDPASQIGMCLRNYAMTMRNYQHTGLVLQIAGLVHVFGDKRDGCIYGQSLHSLMKIMDMQVLPVLCGEHKNIPDDALPFLKEAIVIKGLHTKSFNKRDVLYSTGNEVAFYRQICKASGNEISVFWRDKLINPDHYVKQTKQHADDIMKALAKDRSSGQKITFGPLPSAS